MNASIPMTAAPGAGSTGPRMSLGLGVSLAVHAAVLGWMVHAVYTPAPPAASARPLQVILARPAPPAPPEAAAPPKAEQVPAPLAAKPARPKQSPAPAKAAPKAETPRPVLASPSADSPVAAAPLPERPDATPSTFDPAAARATARQFAREDPEFLAKSRKQEQAFKATRDEKLGEAIDRSRPSDCRTAYAGLGLFAVIPLAVDAVRKGGCRW